ncbi:MAG: major capsid protein [Pseudomonadota bacterium]
MNKNIQRGLLAVGALVAVGSANAAIDISSATAGIGDAQTAVVTVLGLMITMAAAVFGLRKVIGLLGR